MDNNKVTSMLVTEKTQDSIVTATGLVLAFQLAFFTAWNFADGGCCPQNQLSFTKSSW